ncbi:N-lysine methyltransferase SMYD2-B-like [Paramacrobiotus metropolitanus]|uniref:N-lysine methyltransferase SMYD2-B-like n=1 Tax=Paramacrobiotus metropolitanus TaxID=2943436 RepID=UPI002445CD98|nr:N-lysine methyltransferase SMYD2-B-like [Paramacrobiotus metropolitanus]
MEKAPSHGSSRSYFIGDMVISCDPLVWVLESSAYKTLCAYCFQESQELRACSGCHLHRYCNPVCQAADWKAEHKLECAMLKKIGTGTRPRPERGPLGESASGNYPVPTDMIAKLANKIKLNTMMDIPGMGRKSTKDLLLMLPENPMQAEVEWKLQPALSAMESRNSLIDELPAAEFLAYYGMLRYNVLPIYDMLAAPIGLAVYPQAPPRRMTPVCWDINVGLKM